MKNELTHAEQLVEKYYKAEEVSTLKELLYRSAKIYKSRTAFRKKDKNGSIYSITYEKFKNDIVNLGTSLIEKGFLNKRIAVIGNNSYHWCVSYFVATIVGVVVPIDKELNPKDVINFMNVSETSLILGDNKYLKPLQEKENMKEIKNKKTCFINFEKDIESFIEEGKALVEKGDSRFDNIEIDPDEMRILLFTSGTTGNAKGVSLSQRNICSNIISSCGIVKVKRNDVFFSVLPLHHTYECTLGFLLALYNGASIAHCDGLRYISQNMQEYHPSIILCVPLLLENVYKKIIKGLNSSLPEKFRNKDGKNPFPDLPFYLKPFIKIKIKNTLGGRLRLFIVGAAAANPLIIDEFSLLGLKTLQGYGLTECSPLVAGNNVFFQKSDAAGLPLPNVKYKIDKPNKEGVGEILVQGPNVMLGYYNDEKETKKAIKDGWFHTGDLGRVDENGYLYITGRLKSVIVTKNGKNIYPEEVEYYLNDDPLVSESLVSGINKKNDDETYISAQIYPDLEAISELLKGAVPTKEEIKKMISDVVSRVNKRMPNYKHIKSFIIRDKEFEKTTTKKIKRYGNNIKNNKSKK